MNTDEIKFWDEPKTWDEWKILGFRVVKGSKSVGRDSKGKAVFSKYQVTRVLYLPKKNKRKIPIVQNPDDPYDSIQFFDPHSYGSIPGAD